MPSLHNGFPACCLLVSLTQLQLRELVEWRASSAGRFPVFQFFATLSVAHICCCCAALCCYGFLLVSVLCSLCVSQPCCQIRGCLPSLPFSLLSLPSFSFVRSRLSLLCFADLVLYASPSWIDSDPSVSRSQAGGLFRPHGVMKAAHTFSGIHAPIWLLQHVALGTFGIYGYHIGIWGSPGRDYLVTILFCLDQPQ